MFFSLFFSTGSAEARYTGDTHAPVLESLVVVLVRVINSVGWHRTRCVKGLLARGHTGLLSQAGCRPRRRPVFSRPLLLPQPSPLPPLPQADTPSAPPLHRPHSQPHSPPKAVTGPQPSPSSPLGPRTRWRPPARRRPTTLSRLATSLLPGLSLAGPLPGWREVTRIRLQVQD
eukprot:COSAG02_NODE_1972_length_10217_cov_140.461653_5_plen_173_part_00